MSQRENLELEFSEVISWGRMTATKEFLPVITIQNLLRGTLRGLPVTQRSVMALRRQPDKVERVLEEKIANVYDSFAE